MGARFPTVRFRLCSGPLLLLVLASLPVASHELEAKVQLAPPAVVVRASYGGTDPVPFAKVRVFSPASTAKEFLSARTDARGYVSFVPDASGSWRILIDDELGHRAEVAAAVPDPFQAANETALPVPRWVRALVGVSLIAGAAGVLYGYSSRRAIVSQIRP